MAKAGLFETKRILEQLVTWQPARGCQTLPNLLRRLSRNLASEIFAHRLAPFRSLASQKSQCEKENRNKEERIQKAYL